MVVRRWLDDWTHDNRVWDIGDWRIVLRRRKDELYRDDQDRDVGEWMMVVRPRRRVLVADDRSRHVGHGWTCVDHLWEILIDDHSRLARGEEGVEVVDDFCDVGGVKMFDCSLWKWKPMVDDGW